MNPLADPIAKGAQLAPPRSLDAAALLHALAPLLWLPQAALLALAVSRLQSGGGLQAMLLPSAGIMALGVLRAACEAWSAARLHDGAREFLSRWRRHTTLILAARSPLDRERIPAGAAASILAEQAEAILPWLTRYQSAVWRVRIVPVLMLAPIAWYSWVAAGVLVLAAPLIPLFMAIVGWRAKAASEAQWLQLSDMNGFLLDRLRGLPSLRALGSVELTAHRLRQSAEDLRQRTMRVLRIAFLSSAVLELFAALGVALVAVYVGFHLLGHLAFGAWGTRLSLAEGLFVLMLAPAFFEPLRELASVWHDRASGEAAMDALQRLNTDGLMLADGAAAATHTGLPAAVPAARSATTPTPMPAERPAAMPAAAPAVACGPAIKVRGLSFAFPGEPLLFQDFDLDVRPGEKIALVADSGAGKTVLMSLLAGLIPAASGCIEIDGTRLTAASLPALRSRIAWMGQRPHVFAGSVERNVGLGRADATRAQVLQAMHLAQLEDVAQAHPGVTLGEGGTGLSGGEGARLALARLAVAQQAHLLLLDEPTAHLDGDTAHLIRQALTGLAHGRTLIVATHDPLLAAQMDRIVPIGQPAEGGQR